MVHLYTDLIHNIVGFLSTSVEKRPNASLLDYRSPDVLVPGQIHDNYSEDSNGSSETSTVGLVSKDFAAAVQKRLFHAVDVRSHKRCASLLALLEANSTLHTSIKHITIDDLDRRGPKDIAPWFLTEDGLRLLRSLSNLTSLELAERRPRVVDLAAKMLASSNPRLPLVII
jgi:hypothetical protein